MLRTLFRRLTPQSLRPQTRLALPALALLMLAGGGAAGHVWRSAHGADARLALAQRAQEAQDLLEQARSIEGTARLPARAAPETPAAGYAEIARRLDALDRQLAPRAADERGAALRQASQLLRDAVESAARLGAGTVKTQAAFAQALRRRGAQWQAQGGPDGLVPALLLYGLQNADARDEARQLGARYARLAGGAGHQSDAADLLSTRLQLIDAHDTLRRLHEALAARAAALVAGARTQADDAARAERGAVREQLEADRRERLWLLAMLAASLLLAWLALRAALARPGAPAPAPQHGGDEIGDMARAVDRFLQERRQLETSSAELSRVKERLAQQNLRLQQEAMVRSQAEHDLRCLMTEQQTILDNVGVGIAFLKQRHVVRCNASFAAMFGYPQAELIGISTGRLHVSEQAYRERGGSAYAAVGIERSLTGDIELKKRDGTVFWVERTLTAIDPADLSIGAIWVVRDIDQRKRAEALSIEQGRVLEMIATGMPLEAVLDSLARLAESHCDGMMAAILLLDEERRHLRRGAAPSLPHDWIEGLEAIPVGPRGGSCGSAIHRAEAVIVGDALADPLWDDWRPLAAAHGWRACWSTPILSQQRAPLGTLALYAAAARLPTPAETHLMDVASRIAGIAIERRQSEERIRHMAHHDALTGLPNRTLLEDRLNQAMSHAQRHARLVTVVFIDLDNFKLINDSLGHNAGDELLKAVAQRMLRCVRGSDTVVRLGGDEFVIVLCDQPDQPELIARTLQQIREAVAQPVHVGGQKLQVTCSMGLASYPADGADSDTLLMNADAAMYRAKELGRNNFQFYTSALNIRAHERLALQDGLRDALERDQFHLLYQPQRDLRSGRVSGVEALIRWQHPELGAVLPPAFIGLAEESGLIVPIGEWVLRTACRQNKAWQDAGMAPIIMSVNISAAQFRDKKLLGQVAQALRESALAPSCLELELTESLIMQDVGQAVLIMRELQAMGVRLAIDDFGTGYSSLAALKTFPIVRLKIDQSFVRDLPDSEDDKAIATAVISLGHKLKLRVIAEGVETARQQDFLREHECDDMQGYHFSEPVGAEQIALLLRRPPDPC